MRVRGTFLFTGGFMAQYDGSIRINTQINTKQAQVNLTTLENRIVKTSDKIASLQEKLKSLKADKAPTEEYAKFESQLLDTYNTIEKLEEKQKHLASDLKDLSIEQLQEQAKSAWNEFDKVEEQLNNLDAVFSKIESKRNKLLEENPEGAFPDLDAEYDKTLVQYEKLQEESRQIQHRITEINEAIKFPQEIEKARDSAERLEEKLKSLEEAGKAFTFGNPEKIVKTEQELKYAESDLEVLNQKHDVLQLKQKKAADGYKRLGSVAKQSFNSVGKALTKANSYVNSFGRKLKEIAHKILPTFHKETKRTNTVLGQFSTRLKSLLSGIFIFNVISSNIRKMFSGINEGFENFYNQNAAFKSSIDSMRTSLLQLKNTFAAAFAPIVSVAIPYLEKLISYITKAVNSIGQLIAALLGKRTYTKAIRVNVENLEDTSDALEEVEESAKDAEKALDGYLSPLDEINKYNEDKKIKVDIDTEKKPDVSDIGDTVQDMFEEVPIDSYFLDLAGKIKDVFSQIFAPLKEAWNREGKFVMDSWKKSLKEIGALAKSVGSDFLEVWQQEKTVKIFEDLLHIIGDIGLVVGNLARNFRLAWEENETGNRILEGIRDVIGVITMNIRHAADSTVEWSKNLNFSPLLTKIQGLIESLVPVFDNLSGVITDFYEKVLLPLGKWVLEKGLPDLLQVFIDFNNKVDWEALRSRLAQFWEHLEPFAETVGEGLILFIERCANALADFVNSPAFDNFLTMVENWMDSVKPEDVAGALEAIAKSIIALKGGLLAWKSLQTPIKIFGSFLSMISSAKTAKALKGLAEGSAAKGVGDMGKALGGLGKSAGGAAGTLASLKEVTGGLIGNFTMTAGVIATLDSHMQHISQVRTFEETMKSTGEVLGLLKQQVDNGTISLKEFEEERERLAKIQEMAIIKNDEESLTELNAALENTIIKFGLAEESMNSLGTKATETGENISTGLTQGLQSVDILTPVKNICDSAMSMFREKWGIHSPSTVMIEMGKNLIQGLLNGILSLVGDVKAIWEGMKQTAVDIWNGVKDFFGNTWNSIKQTAAQTWEGIKQNLSEKWNTLKTGAKETFDNIKNKIKDSWSNIKTNVKESAENVKTNIANAWSKAKETTASAWSNIKEKAVSSAQSMAGNIRDKFGNMQSAISGFSSSAQSIWARAWEGMQGKVGSVLDSVKNTISSVFGWISSTIGSLGNSLRNLTSSIFSKRSSSSSGSYSRSYSFRSAPAPYYQSPAFSALSTTPIPALARGAVIPANREFLAVLGDQKHGTNIEAPLDTIKQASAEAVMEVLSKLGVTGNMGNNNTQTIIIKQYLDGKQVAESVVKEGKVQQMSSGKNMFLLGTT